MPTRKDIQIPAAARRRTLDVRPRFSSTGGGCVTIVSTPDIRVYWSRDDLARSIGFVLGGKA